jgi:hypothetical protein
MIDDHCNAVGDHVEQGACGIGYSCLKPLQQCMDNFSGIAAITRDCRRKLCGCAISRFQGKRFRNTQLDQGGRNPGAQQVEQGCHGFACRLGKLFMRRVNDGRVIGFMPGGFLICAGCAVVVAGREFRRGGG